MRLRCVWVSHIHADHHVGLPRILSARRALLGGDAAPPLLVIGPRPLRRFLTEYEMVEPLAMHFVDCLEVGPSIIDFSLTLTV
jgi:ribonuclease Z